MGNFFLKHKILMIVLGIFLIVFIGLFIAYKSLIVWEDDSEVVLKDEIAVGVVDSTDNNRGAEPTKPDKPVDSNNPDTIQVKGKITVSVTKEHGDPFKEALITLRTSAGRNVRSANASENGVVVFDEIPAGSYKVEVSKEGDGRIVSKSVNLDEGEVTSVSLSLMLDQEVSITVNVKKSDGSAYSDQEFIITKVGGSEDSVTTNSSGTFTVDSIPPDDNWILKIGDSEVAKFKVAPTGQDQTINVQTSSN